MVKYSEAKLGRVFVLRLEDGDVLHETLESFVEAKAVRSAALIVLGGADEGSRLVVGPEESRSQPVRPMERVLDGVHEAAGVGTIFPGPDGKPILHMHVASGREDATVTGCVRRGVKAWHVLEVVMWELADSTGRREWDRVTGFELLQP